MSDNSMNGSSVEDLPAIEPPPAPVNPTSAIDAQISQIMGIIVRGVLVSAPGVPHHLLLNSIARTTGKLLAMAVTGNTIEMSAKARRDFQDSFRDGLSKVSILQPATANVNPPQR